MRLPVVLLVDLEPDEFFPAPGRAPAAAVVRALEVVAALRPELAAATGRPARLGWRVRCDPAMAVAQGHAAALLEAHGAALDACQAEGDDVGIHCHLTRWRDGGWVLDQGDPAWVEECARVGTEAWAACRGAPPRSFSFGDGWADHRAMGLVADLGYRVDTTLEAGLHPGYHHYPQVPTTGALPDLRGLPPEVFRPSAVDFRVPAAPGEPALGELWVVPMVRLPAGWGDYLGAQVDEWRGNREARAAVGPDHGTGGRPAASRLARVAEKLRDVLLRGRRQVARLSPTLPVASFEVRLRATLARRPGHLALVVRADELHAPRRVENLRTNLLALATAPGVGPVEFVQPVELVEVRAAAAGADRPA